MKKRVLDITIALLIGVAVAFSGCSAQGDNKVNNGNDAPADPSELDGGMVEISFDFKKQSGHASNQFAVWIAYQNGDFLDTIYATEFTAEGGFKNRPDSISNWTKISGLNQMTKEEVDTITGPTPKEGRLTFTWDMIYDDGSRVPPGKYIVYVEGSLRWKNSVIYSAVIDTEAGETTIEADREFIFEGNDDQPALDENSDEAGMIGPVTIKFIP